MNQIAKGLYCFYALTLAGLAFSQAGPVNMAKPPAHSSAPWVAVSAEPPGTNNTALTITSPTALPIGAAGTAYSFSFEATGGLPPPRTSASIADDPLVKEAMNRFDATNVRVTPRGRG